MKCSRVTAVLLLSAALSLIVPAVSFLYPSAYPALLGDQQAASGGPATITVYSYKGVYMCGDVVIINAQVFGIANWLGVTVQFQILGPAGGLLLSGSSSTDSNGQATFQFALPTSCEPGVYEIYASYSYLGQEPTAETAFTVEGPST